MREWNAHDDAARLDNGMKTCGKDWGETGWTGNGQDACQASGRQNITGLLRDQIDWLTPRR